MNLHEISRIAALGMGELARLAVRGELRGANIRLAIKGAARYLQAIEEGDIADGGVQEVRAATCESCTWMKERNTLLDGHKAGYCGEPFVEDPRGPCGCLVMATVNGEILAAGKALVASERCPIGKW